MSNFPFSSPNPSQNSLVPQLKRVRGQIDGIISMIENERDCLEIVQQILAARNALGSVGRTYITEEAVKCSTTKNDGNLINRLLKQLFTLD